MTNRTAPPLEPVELEHELEPGAPAPGPVVSTWAAGAVVVERREEWGALPPKSNPGGFDGLAGTVCHYTAAGAGYMVRPDEPHEWCREQVRSIQRQHQGDPDQSDISYSVLACAHGVAFEGRVLGYRGGANGDGWSNRNEPSVCALIGVGDEPPESLLAVLRAFHLAVEQRAGAVLPMVKHSDRTATSCPGPILATWVDVGGYRSAPIEPPSEDGPMAPDVVQLSSPRGPLPTGAVIIADPHHQTHRWVTSEAELEQLRATFTRRGWVFPNPIPAIPAEWLAQYGVLIGPTP